MLYLHVIILKLEQKIVNFWLFLYFLRPKIYNGLIFALVAHLQE